MLRQIRTDDLSAFAPEGVSRVDVGGGVHLPRHPLDHSPQVTIG